MEQNMAMRRHRIFVHKVYYESIIGLKTTSNDTARKTNITGMTSCQINEQVFLCSIGRGRKWLQQEMYLTITKFIDGQQKIIGSVAFDFNNEKPPTKNSALRHKQLSGIKGNISYKFLSTDLIEIDPNILEEEANNKQQIQLSEQQGNTFKQAQYDEMVKLIQEKDEIIKNLEEKMTLVLKETKLIQENMKREKNDSPIQRDQRSLTGKHPFSINVNLQSQTHQLEIKRLFTQNQNLLDKIKQLEIKIEGLQDHIDEVQSQLSDNRQKIVFTHSQNLVLQESNLDEKPKKRQTSINAGQRNQTRKDLASLSVGKQALGDENWEERRKRRRDERKKNRAFNMEITSNYDKVRSQQKKQEAKERAAKQKKTQYLPIIDNQQQQSNAFSFEDKKKLMSFHKIQEEKQMIEQRFHTKKDEAQGLFKQLQKARLRQKKLEEELQSQRSMINYYKSHGISLGDISQQQKQYLKNLAKRSQVDLNSDFEIGERDRQTVIQERLRFQVVELKDQIQALKSKERQVVQVKDMQINNLSINVDSQKNQKDIYEKRVRELEQMIDGEINKAKKLQEVADKLEPSLSQNKDLEQRFIDLSARLTKDAKQKSELNAKIKRLGQVIEARQLQFAKFKILQSNYDVLKVKYATLQQSTQKFSQNYKELRRFAMRIEQLVSRKTKKGSKDGKSDEEHTNQIVKGIQQMQIDINKAEKQFYKEQISQLSQERKMYQNIFTKRIKEEREYIQNSDVIKHQQKQSIKQEKEKQLTKMKTHRTTELDKKIDVWKKKIQVLDSFKPSSNIEDRVQELRKRMAQGNTVSNQNGVTEMKETIQRLQKEVKSKEQELTKLKRGGHDQKGHTRADMMKDLVHTKQMLSKPFDDLKKSYHDALKQKNALEIQIQNIKIKQEQQVMKIQQKDRQIEKIAKKNQQQIAKKVESASKVENRLKQDNSQLKQQNVELEASIRDLIDELKNISDLLEKKEIGFNKLQDQNKRLLARLNQYQEAQKVLLEEVEIVKNNSAMNQAEFERLFIQRDENFLKIQRVKSVENQKLKDQIYNLQVKLQKELLDSLKIRDQNDRYVMAMAQYDEQIRIIKESEITLTENHTNFVNEANYQIELLQEENQQLQKNLIELAQTITQKQLEIQELKINKGYDRKKIQSLEHLQNDLSDAQEKYFNQKLEAQQLIQDQALQIKKLQANFEIIETKTQAIGDENTNLRTINLELKDQIDDLRTKIKFKQSELIANLKLENDKSALQVKQKEKNYEKRISELVTNISELSLKLSEKNNERQELEQKIKDLELWKLKQSELMKKHHLQIENRSKKQDLNKSIAKSGRNLGAPILDVSRKSINADESANSPKFKRVPSRLRRASKMSDTPENSKKNISFDLQKNSKGSINIMKDLFGQSNASKDNVMLSNVSVARQPNGSNSDHIGLQEVKQSQGEAKGQTMLNPGKTQKLALVRRGSKVEIQVSECESQDINKEQKDAVKQQQSEEQNAEDQYGVSFYGNEEEELYHERQDVASLLDRIQFLEQQRQVLTEQVQNQKDEIIGLKGELQMWKNSVFDQPQQLNQPSVKSLSHGFTSELHRKLSSMEKQKQEMVSKRSIRQPENSFSKSAVIEKPSKVLSRLSNRNIESSEQVKNLQILLDEAQIQVQMLQKQLDGEKSNIQKLIGAINQLEEEIKNHQNKITLLQNQNIVLKQEVNNLQSDLQTSNQVTIAEIQKKRQKIQILSNRLKQVEQKGEGMKTSIEQLNIKINEKQEEIENKTRVISNMKRQFRRYQQQAELQILKLKEAVERLNLQVKNKNQDLEQLGERFVQAQQQNRIMKIQLNSKESLIQGKQMQEGELLKKYYDTVNLLKEQQIIKNDLDIKIQQITVQLKQKQEDIRIMSKQSAITVKKYCIKVESLEEEVSMLRKKLQDREEHLSKLKHQIAIYNDSVIQLSRQKQSLNDQISKLQVELKEIMQSYQGQLDQLNQQRKNALNQVNEYVNLNKNKDTEINGLNKEISNKTKQIREINNKLQETTKNIQRIKIKSRNEVSEVYTELQIKNDELEKAKKQLERQNQDYFSKQCEYIEKIEQNEQKFKEFKQKFVNYEKSINQLGQQLMEYSNRPSIQQWQEVNFQNELYRNRISQLESNLKSNGSSQQQMIYGQFRKYKVNKEREIQDLEAEMERYSTKVNEMQQNSFYLKRQMEGVKHQLKISNNEKQKLQSMILQLQSQNQEMKLQIDLLKARRAQDIGRVLDLSMN